MVKEGFWEEAAGNGRSWSEGVMGAGRLRRGLGWERKAPPSGGCASGTRQEEEGRGGHAGNPRGITATRRERHTLTLVTLLIAVIILLVGGTHPVNKPSESASRSPPPPPPGGHGAVTQLPLESETASQPRSLGSEDTL